MSLPERETQAHSSVQGAGVALERNDPAYLEGELERDDPRRGAVRALPREPAPSARRLRKIGQA
jgi:hypothetical protein